MNFTRTKLSGAWLVDLVKIEDERGFFARTFCRREFGEHGLNENLVQANVSVNHKAGTLRGMHYQTSPYEESKLVRCVRGAIYDVIVDLRPSSPTIRQWIGVHLSEGNYRMLYVPEGFAHGFITLEDDTEVIYQVSEYYTPNSERGLRYDDPALGIEWPISPTVVSEKDLSWSRLEVAK